MVAWKGGEFQGCFHTVLGGPLRLLLGQSGCEVPPERGAPRGHLQWHLATSGQGESWLHFFLSHLSFVDLCYATNVTPQMLVNLLSKRKTISFLGCFIQFDFFISLGLTDSYMLTAMAYDRYTAICKPLLFRFFFF